ncbi:hypothetical protein GLOTRDRAFT_131481 [Gloeophyllum trabeum ATCC 11539]|uniref:Uncharacterized protein n=1 Tax=Gloeophyllum trabeum (strain ATCC 11539 / FP-39264 / Madison 617) TaxID=670483 RepID=S7RKK7_GLOTA|nr:uncharacterized protein GLOTRDRAFT_131481 [Gloeophyllum trabeum ATCC 11539]EPQ53204.1 hypothetical protein GLOTRDRAFT_131481 [Gloeophyllum trabeum ATCC 11539]
MAGSDLWPRGSIRSLIRFFNLTLMTLTTLNHPPKPLTHPLFLLHLLVIVILMMKSHHQHLLFLSLLLLLMILQHHHHQYQHLLASVVVNLVLVHPQSGLRGEPSEVPAATPSTLDASVSNSQEVIPETSSLVLVQRTLAEFWGDYAFILSGEEPRNYKEAVHHQV